MTKGDRVQIVARGYGFAADGSIVDYAICAERLAICAESGDVSEERARELAAEDARRCAEKGACLCRQ